MGGGRSLKMNRVAGGDCQRELRTALLKEPAIGDGS
jgi:hypothetical protein